MDVMRVTQTLSAHPTLLWRAACVWISTRAPLEVPGEFAPAGDSIAGAPAKERRDCKSAD
jgi:hypothetical protein